MVERARKNRKKGGSHREFLKHTLGVVMKAGEHFLSTLLCGMKVYIFLNLSSFPPTLDEITRYRDDEEEKVEAKNFGNLFGNWNHCDEQSFVES